MPSWNTVDEMIMSLPRQERVIVERLRALVLDCLPMAIEKSYYGEGLPFYTHNRLICFIWPSSVYWGKKPRSDNQKSKGVTLGFCQGNKMSNEDGLLLSEGRKQVYVMYFDTLSAVDEQQVRALLYEAGMIDESFKKAKKKSGKKNT